MLFEKVYLILEFQIFLVVGWCDLRVLIVMAFLVKPLTTISALPLCNRNLLLSGKGALTGVGLVLFFIWFFIMCVFIVTF